ncbi:hypothetical protein [Devosia sp.]|uniref:hypothetical protein n=1 Tax=Devosia sp. TaxID=1871048 RepID=UPI0035AFB573
MDGWPPVNCRRFDGEGDLDFRRRSARVSEIVTAFRFGRVEYDEGERLERELDKLQSPAYYHRYEMSARH